MKRKKCTKCNQNKSFKEFYYKKGGKFGLDAKCKSCVSIYQRNHFQKHKKKIIKKRKSYMEQYREKNKIEISEYNRQYYYKNKIAILEYKASSTYRKKMRIYENNKRKNNLSYRILSSLRSRLRIAIKNNSKTESTISLIGCDIEYLKNYLEQQFLKGMSWKNYGRNGWHIDHIVPCSSFDFSDPKQQKQCFHYTNLQPLWAKDNMSKSDKIL